MTQQTTQHQSQSPSPTAEQVRAQFSTTGGNQSSDSVLIPYCGVVERNHVWALGWHPCPVGR